MQKPWCFSGVCSDTEEVVLWRVFLHPLLELGTTADFLWRTKPWPEIIICYCFCWPTTCGFHWTWYQIFSCDGEANRSSSLYNVLFSPPCPPGLLSNPLLLPVAQVCPQTLFCSKIPIKLMNCMSKQC